MPSPDPRRATPRPPRVAGGATARTLSPRPGTAALLLLVLAVALAGCGAFDPAPAPAPVILISIDTLRPDRLGCYGFGGPTTPHLDRTLCADGVVFEEAVAHAPSTLPSHASMLTGLLPAHHGASFHREQGLPDAVTTVAEMLLAEGYRTASFNNGAQVAPVWNLGQGFQEYVSFERLRDHRFDVIVEAGLDWLDGVLADGERERIFLFLHTYETHHPYTPSEEDLAPFEDEPYDGYLGRSVGYRELRQINRGAVEPSAADLAFIEAAYHAEIRSMDRALGHLVEGLRERGLYERALILFTSDHGEEFGEHERWGWHSHTLFDELVLVPLVVKLPGSRAAGERVAAQVRLTDLVPTVLDRLGLPVPGGLDGRSFLPLLAGPPGERRFAVSQRDERGEASIRTRSWKLYGDRLYHLDTDPGERWDVALQYPEVVKGLTQRLEEALEGGPPERRDVELSDEERERLRALGYL